MVDLTSIINSVSAGSKTSVASQTLSADMDTFLKLLTTQMQYQDPLDPMDASEYTNQLVQYSNVEQAIQTNTKLDSLLSLAIHNLGVQATGYVGKTVQALGDIMPLDGGVAKSTYTLSKNVQDAVITVKNMDGKVVYTQKGETTAGAHDFVWDGKDSSGGQLPDGAYQIAINTTAFSGDADASVTTTVFGRVTGVASDDNGIYLGLGDVLTATLDNIVTARDEHYWDNLIDNFKKDDAETEVPAVAEA